MDKFIVIDKDKIETFHEYEIGSIITMNSGAYPAKCVSKEEVNGELLMHFKKGRFVPHFD